MCAKYTFGSTINNAIECIFNVHDVIYDRCDPPDSVINWFKTWCFVDGMFEGDMTYADTNKRLCDIVTENALCTQRLFKPRINEFKQIVSEMYTDTMGISILTLCCKFLWSWIEHLKCNPWCMDRMGKDTLYIMLDWANDKRRKKYYKLNTKINLTIKPLLIQRLQ